MRNSTNAAFAIEKDEIRELTVAEMGSVAGGSGTITTVYTLTILVPTTEWTVTTVTTTALTDAQIGG